MTPKGPLDLRRMTAEESTVFWVSAVIRKNHSPLKSALLPAKKSSSSSSFFLGLRRLIPPSPAVVAAGASELVDG